MREDLVVFGWGVTIAAALLGAALVITFAATVRELERLSRPDPAGRVIPGRFRARRPRPVDELAETRVPDEVLASAAQLTPEARAELAREWNARFVGPRPPARVIVFPRAAARS